MDGFEVSVRGERWRITEREPAGETPAYDLTWLSGPAGGSYGFTIGGAGRTREELVAEVAAFLRDFSAPGGIGEDFPDFVPARTRDEA
jgi:hypothetical protein